MQFNLNEYAMIKNVYVLRITHYVFIICFGRNKKKKLIDATRVYKWRPCYASVHQYGSLSGHTVDEIGF